MSFGIFDGISKSLARDSGRDLAKNFGGANESTSTFNAKFNHMWELTWRAKAYADANHGTMVAAVTDNLNRLKDITDAATLTSTGVTTRRTSSQGLDHLRTYRVAPVSGKYVVFSDIHITDANNRQDFFARANKALYLDVLRAYYSPNDFSLVENGDVEELLIYEPDINGMPDFETASWQTIFNDRETRKFDQFVRILQDHADYYHLVHDEFLARGRYYRTIGNHDTDMATTAYTAAIDSHLGIEWPEASDLLFLSDGDDTDMIICHGHQFDAYCVAAHAKFAGESFSEGGGWAYQGPDRLWSLAEDGRNFINKWLDGSKHFFNMLVSDDPAVPQTTLGLAEAVAGQAIGNLHDTTKWEVLYNKNIAWEYFDNSDPQDAFDDEVKTGERWYKFRHMDELHIVARLEARYGNNGPRLLLGHSHEPRINPGKPAPITMSAAKATNYLNSAAAGRFENLIWGIEIDGGSATVVSWSRDNASNDMVRTVWGEHDTLNVRTLHADSRQSFSPTPTGGASEDERRSIIPAIANMMFSA
ncbi:MAG: hypothetical protein WBN04_17460 [Paracoccaceae bacterium]